MADWRITTWRIQPTPIGTAGWAGQMRPSPLISVIRSRKFKLLIQKGLAEKKALAPTQPGPELQFLQGADSAVAIKNSNKNGVAVDFRSRERL